MVQISILTPVYNESPFISETIRSVQAQSLEDWEMVIVDDGSTDDTLTKVRRFAEQDPRIRIAGGSAKLGKVACFNLAYAESKGRQIVLLGGDDILPEDSLALRSRLLADYDHVRAVAYARLRTFSNVKKHNGLVIPKRRKGNRSGGTLIMNRNLSDEIFPIPPTLVAEDIWIGTLASFLADVETEDPAIVLGYRIHRDNSNPRHLAFKEMTESIHCRARPYELILSDGRYDLESGDRARIIGKKELETARYARQLGRIVRVSDVSWAERFRALSASSPILYGLRRRFFRLFSGWG